MDNNLNNESGIPNVSDIKFDDTPAQSFDNLYGGNNAAPAPGSPVAPSVAPVEPAPAAPSVAPVQPAPVAPSVAPVQPAPVAPSVAPVQPAPVAPSVAPVQPAPVAPSVAPVQPAPVAPSVEPAPMTPNPGTIVQPQVADVSIDADKMQSIEEQLSKTSQYNPEDIQKEMISISTDDKSDKSKSGLAFVIVLFIILAGVIAFLPYITKLIK